MSFCGALLLLFPPLANAGGPPLLCLPIEGVTKENAHECIDRINTELASQLWPHSGSERVVRVDRIEDQWYLTLSIVKDVRLKDVEAAFENSSFSIPRDKLHLFGHVVLEIDAQEASPKSLLADLESLEFTSIVNSRSQEGHLHVTVELPYPAQDPRSRREYLAKDDFRWLADTSSKSLTTATADMLPAYDAIQEIVARHEARLNDVRWSIEFWCRALGCVIAPDRADEPSNGGGRVAAQ
jgi:hypothetical protein